MGYLDQDVIKNIENDLCKTLLEKGITPSILYLDESNWFTYSDNYDKKSQLLRKGHNKKHRNDKNQINVALAQMRKTYLSYMKPILAIFMTLLNFRS